MTLQDTPSHLASKPVMISPLHPVLPPAPGRTLYWQHLFGSSRGLSLIQAARAHGGPVLVITRDNRSAQQLEDELRFYAPRDADLPLLPLPDWESLPYDTFSPHQDILSRRLLTLSRLSGLTQGILLVSVTTLMQRLPPLDYLLAHSLMLDVGDRQIGRAHV